jgi:hypothetical protein
MIYDVYATVRIRITTEDVNRAENTVITLMENAQAAMLDCPAVVETSMAMSPDNPRSEWVTKGGNMRFDTELSKWVKV